MEFTNKVVIITGASGGIGASCALRFASLDANLVLVARNKKNLDSIAQKCEEIKGNKPLIITADVSIEDDIEQIILQTIDRYGKLDVLVNNAAFLLMSGISGNIEYFDKMVATNVRGPYLLTQKALPYLLETKGNIINISSLVSTKPIPAMMAYAMTKAGIDIFTKCIALELGPKGVRANTVNPGPVDTNLFTANTLTAEQNDEYLTQVTEKIPLRKVCKPEDVANLVSFLASDDASCITGSNYVIDCGLVLGEQFF